MAAQAIARTTRPGSWSQTGVAVTMTAGQVGSGDNTVALAAAENVLVLAHNTGGSSATITITSVADPVFGRTGNVAAQTLAAGEIRLFNLVAQGWAANDVVTIAVSATTVKLGAILT